MQPEETRGVDFGELEAKVRAVVLQREQMQKAFAEERAARAQLLDVVVELVKSEMSLATMGFVEDSATLVGRQQDRWALEVLVQELERQGSAVASRVRAIYTLAWGSR